jgi:hypothetical protein
MPNDQFKADVIQVGNLRRAISESSIGDLIFRDKFCPEGIALKDLCAILREERDFETLLRQISGQLQTQVTEISGDLSQLTTIVYGLSGDLRTLEGEFEELRSNVVTISGDLQDQIDDLQEQIDAISGASGAAEFIELTDTPDTYVGNEFSVPVVSGGRLVFSRMLVGSFVPAITASTYMVVNSLIPSSAVPLAQVSAPSEDDTLIVANTFGVQAGSFGIELSCMPPVTGYEVNWMCFGQKLGD